jgi:hypothetical protein
LSSDDLPGATQDAPRKLLIFRPQSAIYEVSLEEGMWAQFGDLAPLSPATAARHCTLRLQLGEPTSIAGVGSRAGVIREYVYCFVSILAAAGRHS